MKNITTNAFVVFAATFLVACGGGGGKSADVITPPPVATYSLSASISKLTSSGLVLQNGADKVSVPANAATAMFPTPLLGGASYNVAIISQPLAFTDMCALSNASGLVGSANVTSVAVACHPVVANVTRLAGGSGAGNNDGVGSAATFNFPTGVALDSAGNAYVADQSNHLIRKITPAGAVTTFAGSGRAGNADGSGNAASFNYPRNVAVDIANNVYVADSGNNMIRKITPAGVVTTLAGNGKSGKIDGIGTLASFSAPQGVAVDAAGNVYVADTMNQLIRKISASGTVTTLAGGGANTAGDGVGVAARFYMPYGIAVDKAGTLFVPDGDVIRKVTSAGVVTTFAGTPGHSGYVIDGTGPAAVFYTPTSVAVDSAGNVFVTDFNNNSIRMITPSGVVTAIAGAGNSNGGGTAGDFHYASGVAVDASGVLYIAVAAGNAIVKVTPR